MSLHGQTKITRLDLSANSPNFYVKKYIKANEENMHVDFGASRVNKGGLKITVLFRFTVIVKLAKISLLAVLLYLTIYHKSSIVLPTPLSIKPPFVEQEIY